MKIQFDHPYVKLATLKAVERYGTTTNIEANEQLLKKFGKTICRKKQIAAIHKAFGVNFDKNDITMNLAAALAALEILKKEK